MSLEVRELGNGTVIEGIESTIDRKDEADLRDFAHRRGCHFLSSEIWRLNKRNWLMLESAEEVVDVGVSSTSDFLVEIF